MCRNATAPLCKVVEVVSAPAMMLGRCCAIRLKNGDHDVKIIAAYLPPFTGSSRDYSRHRDCAYAVLDW
eukprot:13990819-Alexandrium_andersonii.AAC.1